MSQSSSATTLLKAPDLTLKGGLQSVLQSLDVALEDELLRYRNQKQRQAEIDRAAAKVKKAQTIARLKAQAEADALAKAKQSPVLDASLEAEHVLEAAGGVKAARIPLDGVTSETESADDRQTKGAGQQPETDENASSLAIIEADGEAEGDRNITSTAADSPENNGDGEDDYFASSAALLESLGSMPEEDLEGIKFKSEGNPFLKKLMTPAGVGASLLILAGGGAVGYLLANPSSVSHLSPNQLFPDRTEADVVASQSNSSKAIPAELPPGAPDLTQRDFVDLSLSNLGSIDPEGRPIYNPFKLKNSTAGTTLAMAPEQALPSDLPAKPSSTVPGGAAASTPERVQPVQPSLLAGLSNAVAGRSVVEGLFRSKPPLSPSLPPVVSPAPTLAPAPAAPTITFQPEQPLPTPPDSVPEAAYVAPAPAPAPYYPEQNYEAPVEAEPYYEAAVAPEPYYEAPLEADEPYYEQLPSAAEDVSPVVEDSTAAEDLPPAGVESETVAAAEAAIDPLDVPIPFEPIPRIDTYVVEVPYTSDAVLAEVNQLFPNSGAYVENKDSGAVIQVGIYDDAGSAGDAVNALSENGIDAKVENR